MAQEIVFEGVVKVQEKEFSLEMTLEVSADEIEGLFELEFEGKCPACLKTEIGQYDIVCCECLEKAREYHGQNCCPD